MHLLPSCVADLLPDNPYDTMNQGCDFLRNHQSPSVDFATIHLWPDSWLTNVDDERRVQFARRWVNCHVDVCTQLLQKPLVLAEFGWKLDGRAAYYDKVCKLAFSHGFELTARFRLSIILVSAVVTSLVLLHVPLRLLQMTSNAVVTVFDVAVQLKGPHVPPWTAQCALTYASISSLTGLLPETSTQPIRSWADAGL